MRYKVKADDIPNILTVIDLKNIQRYDFYGRGNIW